LLLAWILTIVSGVWPLVFGIRQIFCSQLTLELLGVCFELLV
jgi:hypothetical protein